MTTHFDSRGSIVAEFDDRQIPLAPVVPLTDSQIKQFLAWRLITSSERMASRTDLQHLRSLAAEQVEVSTRIGDLRSLLNALGNEAILCTLLGDLDSASRLLVRRESLCRDGQPRGDLATILNLQAKVSLEQGELAEAVRLYEEESELHRERGDTESLIGSLLLRAEVLLDRLNQPTPALALVNEAQELADLHQIRQMNRSIRQLRVRITP